MAKDAANRDGRREQPNRYGWVTPCRQNRRLRDRVEEALLAAGLAPQAQAFGVAAGRCHRFPVLRVDRAQRLHDARDPVREVGRLVQMERLGQQFPGPAGVAPLQRHHPVEPAEVANSSEIGQRRQVRRCLFPGREGRVIVAPVV